MPEILSQEEIDALLNNLDKEEIAEEVEEEPLEELVEPKKISVYDFKRPDKVSKEQIRAIKNLHDKFSRNFSSKLSAFLRSIVEIEVVSVDQMTYAEFVLSLSNNVSFNVVSLSPLDGNAVFSLEPDIGFALIDRLLGGIGESSNINRPFTDIEQSILLDVVRQAMEEMRSSWEPIIDISFEVVGQESSPNVVQIVAPSEIVVLVVFEVKLGETTGIINWCLPVIVLEPVLNKIGTHDILARSKKATEDRIEDIARTLKEVLVYLEFRLGTAAMKVEDFLSLKEGDLLTLDKKVDDELPVFINGVEKYGVKLGRKGYNKAVKINRIIG
ncbi:flagellar motor switch protein FliM [Hippea maritima]|uniref:Flagellar motor switch protein FliM n=1 Tax=Hippea maritima (strain ATCC 700847 / DSM 10411 / MH2) TaxID=760142 RepID=F2LXL1_HIPMA|nr:flagellar motor switch protein FliM [Hippea maritima]AEA33197.1 flagellar motor switch protein FliM [Hippea maritima DSM 10411]